MSFDPENIPLISSAWFSDQIAYAGRGRAEFLDPLGAVEGQARVWFDEYGKPSIELDVEKFESAQPLQMGLMQLISGQKPIIANGVIGISGGGEPPNPCTKLSVTTPQGEFFATEGIHYGYSFYIGNDRQAKLTFSALRSQYDVAGGSPRYWVLPLTNFLSRFVAHHPTLDRHPLRIYPTPVVPDGLTGDDALIATHNANLQNRLITFEFKGGPGFIEPLADYDVRDTSLLEGCKRLSVTAVMVGEVGSESIDQADLEDWFPDDFLRLLSLATGTQVGAPWIEFRDGDGKLIRRIHVQLNQVQFSKGRQPLEEGVHSGIGYLLTRYQASPERGKSYLTVAIKHLSHAARSGQSMEDKFIYLIRALDNLCEHYGFSTQYLMQSLDAHWQQSVRQILDSAAQQIRAEARTAARAGQFDQSRTLETIAERTTQTPTGKDQKFGLAVADLLKHFSLPDADIIDAHYQANPRPDGIQTWSGVLSYYRSAPIHTGFFNISGKKHDFDDIYTIMNHLHDVLLRIIFRIIGYDGTYQPPVITMSSIMPTDWVVPGLPARQLGYE
jgi:hypothetical protein